MARAPWRYTGRMHQVVRAFKYRGRWRFGRWLAQGMVATARDAFPIHTIDAVVPVPRHWLTRRLRGQHPAGRLARAVAIQTGLPLFPRALRCRRWTRSQTRLRPRERFRNVMDAFTATARVVRHRRVLLVDDVFTTGATANACAAALKVAGARRVFVLTAARAVRRG